MENSRQILQDDQSLKNGSEVYDVASMPGFRFQPTEEELVGFYLRSMVIGNRLEVELINVLDLYRYDPWELPAMAFMQGEREWLFFCPRDKKYPNGARPNRVTASGYWKATGTDRQVRRAQDSRCIGLKKTLVFYTGKAPKGRKTEWIMNEYRLPQNDQSLRKSSTDKDTREVALCRIYKKPGQNLSTETLCAALMTEDLGVKSSKYPSKTSERQSPGALDSKTILHHTTSEELSASTCRSERKPHPTSSSSNLVTLKPGGRSILDEIDTTCAVEATKIHEYAITACSRQLITPNQHDASHIQDPCSRSVKMEAGTLSSVLYPRPAPDKVDSIEALLSAQLMEAEAPRGRSIFLNSSAQIRDTPLTDIAKADASVLVSNSGSQYQVMDGLTWLRQEQGCPGDADQQLHPSCSNLTTISSIDRLLKTSMWSPLPPSLPAAKDGNGLHSSASLFSNQLGWNYSQPPWLNSTPPALPAMLQIQGQHHSTK